MIPRVRINESGPGWIIMKGKQSREQSTAEVSCKEAKLSIAPAASTLDHACLSEHSGLMGCA